MSHAVQEEKRSRKSRGAAADDLGYPDNHAALPLTFCTRLHQYLQSRFACKSIWQMIPGNSKGWLGLVVTTSEQPAM